MVNADKRVVKETDGHLSSQPMANSVSEMAPNRHDFEKNLRRLNNGSETMSNQMKKYWTDVRRDEINRQRDIISELQRTFNNDSVDERRLSNALNEQQTRHTIKQREIHEMEDVDLTYRNLAQAQQRLAMAEERYNKHNFASMREERLQVAEIDRVRRNIAKLSRYIPLVEEKKALEVAIKDLRQEIRSIRSKMRSNRDILHGCKMRIREIKAPYNNIKKKLYELNEEKRRIIKQYEQDRQNYILWMQQNNVRGISSFPIAMVQGGPMDRFEPFWEQKKTCSKLLRYLRALRRDCEPASSESHVLSDLSAESSADEFPESFKHLKINNADIQLANDLNHSKKKNYVKKYVKKTLPITHSIDYIRLFADIDVNFPVTYAEVDEIMGKVQEALNFYNDQTNLERLEDRSESPFSSMMSHNGSDLMDMSFVSLPSPSSSSSLVIIEDPNQLPTALDDESNMNLHFPKLRTMDPTGN